MLPTQRLKRRSAAQRGKVQLQLHANIHWQVGATNNCAHFDSVWKQKYPVEVFPTQLHCTLNRLSCGKQLLNCLQWSSNTLPGLQQQNKEAKRKKAAGLTRICYCNNKSMITHWLPSCQHCQLLLFHGAKPEAPCGMLNHGPCGGWGVCLLWPQ